MIFDILERQSKNLYLFAQETEKNYLPNSKIQLDKKNLPFSKMKIEIVMLVSFFKLFYLKAPHSMKAEGM